MEKERKGGEKRGDKKGVRTMSMCDKERKSESKTTSVEWRKKKKKRSKKTEWKEEAENTKD